MRGRRRSPGPPGGFRRDERRFPSGPRDRRRRSFSPDRFRRAGSPPPFKRGRYGREQDDFYPPRGYHENYSYDRPSPPPREGPRTYKDFCRTLPDDVTPEEAQKEYQQYLSEYWGSEVRADFEAKKNEDWMKRRFEPRGMEKAMQDRNEEAQKAATSFSEDLKAGILDPKSEDFNQGAGITIDEVKDATRATEETSDGEEGKAAEKPAKPEVEIAPEVTWKPERIRSDALLSMRLISKLDAEKSIENSHFAHQSVPEKPAESAAAEVNGEVKAEVVEVKPEAAVTEAEASGKEAVPEGDASKEESVTESIEDATQKLDLQLTYLWRVHGVDYYCGKELFEPSQFESRSTLSRILRGPRPEEGEKASDAEEKKALKLAEKRIDQVWKKRLVSGDPFATGLQKEKVEKLVDDWVEDQVKKIADNKWGCKLSQKLFVGRDYVLKHVRLKHTEKVDAQRSKILDDIFFDNYKKFREEEQRLMQAEMARVQQAMQLQQNLPGAWDGVAQSQQGGAGPEGIGGFGAPGFSGPAMRPSTMVPQRPMMMPAGMMPGPGQMLVLAPGAGPMGPFISVPISEATGMGGRGMGPMRGPPMRGPGGRAGRGFFPHSFGGGPMPSGKPNPRENRGYYDLDNPSNNRAVLDYGDL